MSSKKKLHRHTIFKLLKIKEKRNILTEARGEKNLIYKGTKLKLHLRSHAKEVK
jgi:hypothetical protein